MDTIINYIDWQDIAALLFFVFCWVGYALYTEHERHMEDHLLAVTNRYRTLWMREMLKRDNRSVDAIMVGNLQRSITFFASTTIFLLIGLISMLGYHDRATSVFGMIPFAKATTPFMWEMRIFLLMLIFVYAFFKYTWSLRQYNYAGIFIVAVPLLKEESAESLKLADKGSAMVSNAAKHFNDALRAYYYGLAALAWFVHPFLFMLATAWVVFVAYRREYRSATLRNLAS